jgi:hypothetical protein
MEAPVFLRNSLGFRAAIGAVSASLLLPLPRRRKAIFIIARHPRA